METPLDSRMRPHPLDLPIARGLLLLGLMAVPSLSPLLNRWPVAQLLPIVCFTLLLLAIPPLRRDARWLRAGKLDRRAAAAAVFLAAASSASLLAWARAAGPDFHRFASRIPTDGPIAVLLGGTVFALVNATVEETAWRGVIQDALEARLGIAAAVAGQALAFGAGHYAGIPGGIAGVFLASLYGFMLGLLRRAVDGLLLCIAAHVCADATIYALVARSIAPR